MMDPTYNENCSWSSTKQKSPRKYPMWLLILLYQWLLAKDQLQTLLMRVSSMRNVVAMYLQPFAFVILRRRRSWEREKKIRNWCLLGADKKRHAVDGEAAARRCFRLFLCVVWWWQLQRAGTLLAPPVWAVKGLTEVESGRDGIVWGTALLLWLGSLCTKQSPFGSAKADACHHRGHWPRTTWTTELVCVGFPFCLLSVLIINVLLVGWRAWVAVFTFVCQPNLLGSRHTPSKAFVRSNF